MITFLIVLAILVIVGFVLFSDSKPKPTVVVKPVVVPAVMTKPGDTVVCGPIVKKPVAKKVAAKKVSKTTK